ncbi:MAG: thioesterase [Gammaproteobacteria bacterium HGW-Gammaproteobacteria-14]|nr:MAG: thioesterase [Gammaproteobacteria bacterium HGW-Gammaproteobacteria-14]
MFETYLQPRFYETDAFGHINNTTVAGWFETAREPLFRLLTPMLEARSLPLILARIEIDFVAQLYYGSEVLVTTAIEKIGNSSFVVLHKAYQGNVLAAKGRAVQVFFDHESQKSMPLPKEFRQQLTVHLLVDTDG